MVFREDQVPIMEYEGGTMAVPAVPGAGKTFIVTNLVTKLIEHGNLCNKKILIVTYMNSAVNNFKTRIHKLLDERDIKGKNHFEVMTLHSLALKVLKEKPEGQFISEDFRVIDDLLKNAYLEEVIEKWKISRNPITKNVLGEDILRYFIEDKGNALEKWNDNFSDIVKTLIGELKLKGIKPEVLIKEFSKDLSKEEANNTFFLRIIAPIYDDYSKKLRQEGFLDYEDILILAYEALLKDSELREKFQSKYAFIFEDECQDSNEIQCKLLNLLSEKHHNLVRVGDVNQSINGSFSSADPEYFREFYSTCDYKYEMNMSQRSSKDIIDMANYLVEKCSTDMVDDECKRALDKIFIKPVEKNSSYKSNPEVNSYNIHILSCEDFQREIAKVALTIKRFKEKNKGKNIGVLVPYNNQVLEVGEALRKQGIDCDELCNNSREKRKITDKIAYILRFLAKPYDIEALFSIFQVILLDEKEEVEILKRYFEDIDIRELFLDENIEKFLKPLKSLENYLIIEKYMWSLKEILNYKYSDLIEYILYISFKLHMTVEERAFTDYVIYYLRFTLRDNPSFGLLELSDILLDYKNRVFNQISEIIFELNGYEPKEDGVTICTYHKSKGMEWDAVFLMDLTDYKFPYNPKGNIQGQYYYLKKRFSNPVALGKYEINRFLNENEKLDNDKWKREVIKEKARLLYVGITRAKEFLILSYSNKSSFGKVQKPSVYVNWINEFKEKQRW